MHARVLVLLQALSYTLFQALQNGFCDILIYSILGLGMEGPPDTGEQPARWRSPVHQIHTYCKRAKALPPQFSVLRVGCQADPLVRECPMFVCNLKVPGCLDEDTGETIEDLVRPRGRMPQAARWVTCSALLCAQRAVAVHLPASPASVPTLARRLATIITNASSELLCRFRRHQLSSSMPGVM